MQRDFCFTGQEVVESKKEAGKKKSPENPLPERLKGSSSFVKEAWDVWFHLHPALKRQLRKSSPNKSLRESNGDLIFKFQFERNQFKLIILQEWAAKRLGLPQEYTSKKHNIDVIIFCAEVLEKIGILKKGSF